MTSFSQQILILDEDVAHIEDGTLDTIDRSFIAGMHYAGDDNALANELVNELGSVDMAILRAALLDDEELDIRPDSQEQQHSQHTYLLRVDDTECQIENSQRLTFVFLNKLVLFLEALRKATFNIGAIDNDFRAEDAQLLLDAMDQSSQLSRCHLGRLQLIAASHPSANNEFELCTLRVAAQLKLPAPSGPKHFYAKLINGDPVCPPQNRRLVNSSLAASKMALPEHPQSPERSVPTRGFSQTLLVEDNEVSREIAMAMLASAGMSALVTKHIVTSRLIKGMEHEINALGEQSLEFEITDASLQESTLEDPVSDNFYRKPRSQRSARHRNLSVSKELLMHRQWLAKLRNLKQSDSSLADEEPKSASVTQIDHKQVDFLAQLQGALRTYQNTAVQRSREITAYEKVVAQHNLGTTLMCLGRLAEAVAIFEAALGQRAFDCKPLERSITHSLKEAYEMLVNSSPTT